MSNEHNPIALRINTLQQQWTAATKKNPDYKLIRWLIVEDDLPLINGFYKLESSAYGSMEEMPVILLNDFEEKETFSYQIAENWLEAYEKEAEKYSELLWKEFPGFKQQFDQITDPKNQNGFLIEILQSFQNSLPEQRKLVVGLNPRNVHNYKAFNNWLDSFIENIPDKIALSLIDYKNDREFDRIFSNYKAVSISIALEDMDMKGAYNDLITHGNPNDPQVQFRKCMLEMGKASAADNQKEVDFWGHKMLDITQSTGIKSFWASAHLIYAGFLFTFKADTIIPLLDKGIQIAEASSKEKDQASFDILLQLYGYKAAYYSIAGEPDRALDWFIQQSSMAIKHDRYIETIGACKNAILIAEKHNIKKAMNAFLEKTYPILYDKTDEELKITEFFTLSRYFLNNNLTINKATIDSRMKKLFGTDWKKRTAMDQISAPKEMV